MLLRLSDFGGNPTGFTLASDIIVDEAEAPPNLIIRDDHSGFDGMGFYRLALDPFTRERIEFGILMDHPAFRYQRILYPLLAWSVSGGDRVGAAWALIGINVAGLAAIAWLGVALAQRAGRAGWWGLLFAANPAFAIALGVDTAEIVAGVGLLAALLLLRDGRYRWATVALTAGMFARETILIVAVGGLAAWAFKRGRETPVWVWLVPGGIYLGWQVFLGWWWGGFALGQGAGLDIGLPFAGIAEGVSEWIPPAEALDVLHLILLAAIVGLTIMAIRATIGAEQPAHESAGLLLASALIAITAGSIWFHHWGFLRATSELYMLSVLAVLSRPAAPRHRLVLAPAICISIWLNMLLYP